MSNGVGGKRGMIEPEEHWGVMADRARKGMESEGGGGSPLRIQRRDDMRKKKERVKTGCRPPSPLIKGISQAFS